ncbi:MAG: hypothetical protein IJ403_05260 [Oscillospiraceae bacterium]|nr:hypothetical protein [Oscillospiraceae bacterium]
MTPIEKNIIVVDEQGNEYEATYPKRAKGLVKNGRARFIDENTICLACPPNTKLEDKNMSENTPINNEVPEAMTDLLNTADKQQCSQKFTIDYILSKIEELSQNQEFLLTDMLSKLEKLKSGGPGDVGTQGIALAIAEIVKARTSNTQKLIALYEKMYNDLSASEAQKNTPQQQVVQEMTQILKSGSADPEQRRVAFELLVCMFTK